MVKFGIWVVIESLPGKEADVEAFLKSAEPLAEKEPATLTWYAVKIGPSKYAIFDTFSDEAGRNVFSFVHAARMALMGRFIRTGDMAV